MRQVGDRLGDQLERPVAHLVEIDGEQHRRKGKEYQLQQRDRDGVAEHDAHVRALKEVDEVLEPAVSGPRAAEHALEDVEVLEGDQDAVQRQVIEDDHQQQARQDHEVDVALCVELPPPRGAPFGG